MSILSLFHKDINKRLAEHISELNSIGKVPLSWFWDKNTINSLSNIDIKLIQDIEELHKNHSDNSEIYPKLMPLLQTLHKDLSMMIDQKNIDGNIQAKEADIVNNIINSIHLFLQKENYIEKVKKLKEAIRKIDFDKELGLIRASNDKHIKNKHNTKIERNDDGHYLFVVDKFSLTFIVYDRKNEKVCFSTPCTTGRSPDTGKNLPNNPEDYFTPNGLHEIVIIEDIAKAVINPNPLNSANKYIKSDTIFFGPYGFVFMNKSKVDLEIDRMIHGTHLPEYLGKEHASGGCVRISDEAVTILFKKYVKIGTPVLIYE